MKFTETKLVGVYLIESEKRHDERGSFMRTYCEEAFRGQGIAFTTRQCNSSYNKESGTLRGMHFQKAPHEEAKLVRCTRGKIYDVAVDLRPDSSTYCQWVGAELSAGEGNALFIPEGFAHGFLTLEAESEVFYHMGAFYHGELASGVRWDDPAFGIKWPGEPKVIGEKDRGWGDYVPASVSS